MDNSTTMLEIQSALTNNNIEDVANVMMHWHSTTLEQMLRAVQLTYVKGAKNHDVDAARELIDAAKELIDTIRELK